MRMNPLILAALIGWAGMTAACANWSRPSAPAPWIRITPPEMALRPCRLPILPDEPSWADLEQGYLERGRRLLECEAARRLAIETLETQWKVMPGPAAPAGHP